MRGARLRRALVSLVCGSALALGVAGVPAFAEGVEPPAGPAAPATNNAPSQWTAKPVSKPTATCKLYASSSGYGMLCSDAAAGKTLAQVLKDAGINPDREFCWDDPDLPDGFVPEKVHTEPGRWWVHTCLSFDGAVVRANARVSYTFVFLPPNIDDPLVPPQKGVIESVTGRGQIPYLQMQTSPVSSPRVDQDVAFSLLCDAKVTCTNTDAGRKVSTPRLDVGGVQMWGEIVHLKVLPEGSAGEEIGCTGAGLPRTAQELDERTEADPAVCRWKYDRSSNAIGGSARGDRYPAKVTAYWQVYFDEGDGRAQTLGQPYEKTTTNNIRVTEVQTLVVS